ncbi:bifunctional 5,10-methylene-tetrahydrofolate dehydrogenase/5,10-methylene-tetrahydrofolate cyclohydrolase [candidate division KSB1 bacterium]|nr:bifunctional 5,10-methylene-tetrahydrofolate dehydrogenase/5,10-methylene-tetrahydrofolate cyclohydrolase [candidate division KSB1 bacterium]
MSAHIINGKEIAKEIYAEMSDKIKTLKEQGIVPHLSVVLVGEDPASKVYVGMKQKKADQIGLSSKTIHLPENTVEENLLGIIDELNNDDSVHGILVQLPLPKHISEPNVIKAICPDKDVDGFHPVNRGKLVSGEETFLPCTPSGIQQLLIRSGYSPERKHVVVIGRSGIVGMPFAIMMMQKKKEANATVTICHTGTRDIASFSRQADIVIVAAGRPNTLTADMVKAGAVVIDVGTNRVDDPAAKRGYRLVGDADFDGLLEKTAAITPVPGGVGPMTIAMLMVNTVKAATPI